MSAPAPTAASVQAILNAFAARGWSFQSTGKLYTFLSPRLRSRAFINREDLSAEALINAEVDEFIYQRWDSVISIPIAQEKRRILHDLTVAQMAIDSGRAPAEAFPKEVRLGPISIPLV